MTRQAHRYLLTGGTFNVVDLSNKYTIRVEFQGRRHGTRSVQLRALNKDDFAKWWDALNTLRAKSVMHTHTSSPLPVRPPPRHPLIRSRRCTAHRRPSWGP